MALCGVAPLLPLGVLIALLIMGYTPAYVAAGSTAAVIMLSWFWPASSIGPRRFVQVCTDTITQIVPLVGAVAAAGIVIGAIEISALAGKFTLLINYLAFGQLVPTLILSAVFLVLLGMGMPTPAVYITGAALLAPVLRQNFNLPRCRCTCSALLRVPVGDHAPGGGGEFRGGPRSRAPIRWRSARTR